MFDFSGYTPALRCPLCRSAAVWNHPIPHQDNCPLSEPFTGTDTLRAPRGGVHYALGHEGRTFCGISCHGFKILEALDHDATCVTCLRERCRIDLAALWLEMSADAVDLYLAAQKVLDKEIANYERVAVKNLVAVMERMGNRSPLDREYNRPFTAGDADLGEAKA